MKKKFIILLFSILFVYLFLRIFNFYFTTDREKIADRITLKTAKILKEEKNLSPIGFGGSMMEDVKIIYVAFTYINDSYNVNEARKLIVYCAEKYINEINNNKKIRPYLHNYPFKADNLELDIFFKDQNNLSPPYPNIYFVSLRNGLISYKVEENDESKLIHKEPFEEAQEIVHKESTF